MNVAYPGPWAQISEADALLMDVARRIRLSKTKYETAETNFRALCQHVDREGSPLQGKVVECYASGSFATGTAIASRVAKNQHDVDVVIELDVPSDAKRYTGTSFRSHQWRSGQPLPRHGHAEQPLRHREIHGWHDGRPHARRETCGTARASRQSVSLQERHW